MAHPLGKIDGYSYYISNDSDDDNCQASDSSDDEKQLDEIDVFLYGTADQQRKALQRLTGDEASSSEDEFEKTMKKELNEKMALHEKTWMPISQGETSQPCSSQSCSKPSNCEMYDDVYFDSDDDENDQRVKAKKKKLTNDELFYDPLADDRDQDWINKRRIRGSAPNTIQQDVDNNKKSNNKQNSNETVLTCPACLTTLCVDCQRHELYQDQYRAMFVMNCKVVTDEILRYKEPKKKVFKRHRRKQAAAQSSTDVPRSSTDVPNSNPENDSETVYRPVRCETCDTQVAVYDKDEIYYFFNILAGPA